MKGLAPSWTKISWTFHWMIQMQTQPPPRSRPVFVDTWLGRRSRGVSESARARTLRAQAAPVQGTYAMGIKQKGRRNGWRAASTRISDWSSEQHPSASRRTITISSKLITEQRCNAILSSFLDCWFWNHHHHHHHHGPFRNTFPPCPSCSIDLPPVPYWHSVSVPSLCIAVPYCPGFYIHFVHLTPGWLHTLYIWGSRLRHQIVRGHPPSSTCPPSLLLPRLKKKKEKWRKVWTEG